ncbi:MAG: NAD/NADP octopine/nopaline dehydrogenase family protein [Acidimicrobiales bacterium]|jgi:opine dehydrogenase
MKVAVFGSGAGALSVAADLSLHGREVVMADLPEFAANLAPVRAQGGVRVVTGGRAIDPVSVLEDPASAVAAAEMLIVVVPQFGHEPWVKALLPHLRANHSLLFMGEGCGALFARPVLVANGKQDVVLGETNTLPYVARVAGPGAVSADRKSGGTFLAGLPAAAAEVFMSQLGDVWPYMSAAENVFETVLINYNAIDHVATILSNAGTIENRTGGMLLWGEGATPSVVRVIEAVDGELLSIRTTLGFSNQKRYRDLLIEQGFAPDAGPGLYEVLRASRLVSSYFPTGPSGLETRYLTEDVPYSLALASSIAHEIGVLTPVIDGLIAIASAMHGRDFRAEGRSLAKLGLAGLGLSGLIEFAKTGKIPG